MATEIRGDMVVSKKEARRILKENEHRIQDSNVTSFVSLKDINKIYPNGVQAVYDFNLDIDKHDFVVLVGPSGCGKSTTLRMIAGLEDITSGYLYIDKVLSNYLESKNRDISMVFQSYALYPQMTVYDNIAFPLKVRKYPKVLVDYKLKYSHDLINILNNIDEARLAIINSLNLDDKKINKIRYLAKALKVDFKVGKELLGFAKQVIDELSLNRNHLIALTKEKIEKEEANLRKNNTIWNEKFEIIYDGSKHGSLDVTLLRNHELNYLFEKRYEDILDALDDAYDPKVKVHDKAAFIAKKLKINLNSARFICENRVILIKNNEKDIEALISELNEEIAKREQEVLASGKFINDHFEIVDSLDEKHEIKVNEILKVNHEILDILENHFDEFRLEDKDASYESLASKYQVEVQTISELRHYRTLSNNEIANNIAQKIDELNNRIALEEKALEEKGIKVNENYEILDDNEQPVIKKVKLNKEEIREKVFNAANVLDLGPYLDRRPKELSGGQMQRVALGRAIVRNAKLFLMDEPLSNLDAKLRVQMRSEIVLLHERIGATTIYVTHDQTEAMTMGTKIVVMSKGWVQQVGTPQYVYDHPTNLFVATFIGSPSMNILEANVSKNKLTLNNGYTVDLGKGFKKIHDEFYERKIAECEKMLITLDKTVEVQCLNIFNYLKELARADFMNHKDEIIANFNFMLEKIKPSKKDSSANLLKATEQAKRFTIEADKFDGDVVETYDILESLLKNYESIHKSDIAKIFSAQAFEKENKENKEVKELSYDGRKHENVFARLTNKIKNVQVKHKLPDLEIGDPYEYLTNLKKTYEDALKGDHMIKVGIRPENIHLASEYNKETKTDNFKVKIEVVELMGNEALIHAPFGGIDLLAKIVNGRKNLKAHDEVELTCNKERLHIFDASSGETII